MGANGDFASRERRVLEPLTDSSPSCARYCRTSRAQAELEWCSADRHVIEFERGSHIRAAGKGKTEIWAKIPDSLVQSPRITVEVWNVDHVLLTPRTLEISLGKKKQILAEATNDDGDRATNVFLNWKHDADDQLIVRIHPAGWVTGNAWAGRASPPGPEIPPLVESARIWAK